MPNDAANDCKAARVDCQFTSTKRFRAGSILAGIVTDSQPKPLAKSCDTGKMAVIPSPTCSHFLLQLVTPTGSSPCLVSYNVSTPVLSSPLSPSYYLAIALLADGGSLQR